MMSELAERAEKLWLTIRDESDYDATIGPIEQALLRERRLAFEEAAKMLEVVGADTQHQTSNRSLGLMMNNIFRDQAAKLRAVGGE